MGNAAKSEKNRFFPDPRALRLPILVGYSIRDPILDQGKADAEARAVRRGSTQVVWSLEERFKSGGGGVEAGAGGD
jgi:hypothetical protein